MDCRAFKLRSGGTSVNGEKLLEVARVSKKHIQVSYHLSFWKPLNVNFNIKYFNSRFHP